MGVRGKGAGAPSKPKQKGPKVKKPAKLAKAGKPAETAAVPPKTAKSPPPTATLSEDQLQALFHIHLRRYQGHLQKEADAKEDYESAKNTTRAYLKEAKADGIGLDSLKDGIALLELDGEAKLQAEIKRKLQVAKWMAAPIGSQADLFGTTDRTPAIDRARAEGKAACFRGDPRRPAHDPSVPQYAAWIAGYDEAQAVLMKGFKPLPQAAPPADQPVEASEQEREVVYEDGQPDANGAEDGRPVGSVPPEVTSGTPVTRSEYEAMKDQGDVRPRHLQTREAEAIGTEDPSYTVVH